MSKSVYKTYNLSDFGFPEVPYFGNYHTDKAYNPLEPHTHEAFEICFLAKGRQNYSIHGKDYLLKSGDIFITRPGEIHSSGKQAQEKGELFWINILPELKHNSFLGYSTGEGKALIKCLYDIKARHFPGSKELLRIFTSLRDEVIKSKSNLGKIFISNTLVSLVLEISSCALKKQEEKESDLNRVLHYIEEHIEEPLRVPALAGFLGLSTSWFKARFRKETGLSPAEYVLRKRVYKAREFLELGGGNVSDAAMKYGFSSSQHFATAFKRYNKLTPSTYVHKGS